MSQLKREENLRRCADLLEGGAWCQGPHPLDGNGNAVHRHADEACARCALLTIEWNVVPYPRCWEESPEAVALALHLRGFGSVEEFRQDTGEEFDDDVIIFIVGSWNDEPGRKKSEVVQAFRDCADKCERGEL